MNSIPDWMQKKENYDPPEDRDAFTRKSILSLMGILSGFRQSAGSSVSEGLKRLIPSAPMGICFCLYTILLVSCSQNMFFSYCILAFTLICLCILKDQALIRVFSTAFIAALFSAIVLIPAVFLGSPHTMLTVSVKVFISVNLVGILASSISWNRITEGLRFYHVPDLFIFTFDITLKYIVILGDICVNMLSALKLRSVGHNHKKGQSISGILGVTYLKSREMAEDMCGAMACRGFEGEYIRTSRRLLKKSDIIYLVLLILFTLLFIWLQKNGGTNE